MGDRVNRLLGEALTVDDSPIQAAYPISSALGSLEFFTGATEGRIRFDATTPCLQVPLPRLDGEGPACEIWRTSGHLTSGQREDIHYRHDEAFVFGVIVIPESRFTVDAVDTPLRRAAEAAYRQVFALLDELSFPHLLRFWNYLPDINVESFGVERYWQFNIGRQEAFLAHGRDVLANLPAACALGMAQGALSIAFLAGRRASQGIENPRQTSAFQYPPQYGPRSPTFSRATLVNTEDGVLLLVSGTASIVGHRSVHPGDVTAQTREALDNIEAVLAQANRLVACGRFDLAGLNCRVYVRHTADLEAVRAEMTRRAGASHKAVYLQADICRRELLLEIEATASLSSGRND